MKRLSLILAISALPLLAFAQPSGSARPLDTLCPPIGVTAELTLPEVLSTVMCANPTARKAAADYAESAAQLKIAKSALYPTLTLGATGARNLTDTPRETGSSQGNISAALNYLVYDFGGRAASIESATALLIANKATQTVALQALYYSTVQAYYAVFSSQESSRAAASAKEAAEYSEKAAQAMFDAGVATKAEVLQAKTAVAQAHLNKIRAQGELRQAQGALAVLMGRPVSDIVALAAPQSRAPDSLELAGISQLLTVALANREDLKAMDRQLEAAEHNIKAAIASGRPSVSLSASTGQVFSSLTASQPNNSALGFTVTIPVFNGYKTSATIEAAKQKLAANQESRDALMHQIKLDVWNAYQTLETNSAAQLAAEDLLASSRASHEVALGKYKAGVGLFSDVLSAQSALASAEQSLLTSKYALYLSRFSLSRALGVLMTAPTSHE